MRSGKNRPRRCVVQPKLVVCTVCTGTRGGCGAELWMIVAAQRGTSRSVRSYRFGFALLASGFPLVMGAAIL